MNNTSIKIQQDAYDRRKHESRIRASSALIPRQINMRELKHNSQLLPQIAIVFDLKPYVRGFANDYLCRVKIFTSSVHLNSTLLFSYSSTLLFS